MLGTQRKDPPTTITVPFDTLRAKDPGIKPSTPDLDQKLARKIEKIGLTTPLEGWIEEEDGKNIHCISQGFMRYRALQLLVANDVQPPEIKFEVRAVVLKSTKRSLLILSGPQLDLYRQMIEEDRVEIKGKLCRPFNRLMELDLVDSEVKGHNIWYGFIPQNKYYAKINTGNFDKDLDCLCTTVEITAPDLYSAFMKCNELWENNFMGVESSRVSYQEV